MTEITNSKHFDLEDRTMQFAKDCRDFVRQLPRTISNIEYGKQLVRSSSSPAANYIEADEALGKKDFACHIRICRKETKESCLWLKLCEVETNRENIREGLLKEAGELRSIFTAILGKVS